MKRIISKIKANPKTRCKYKFIISEKTEFTLDYILQWINDNTTGNVFWNKTKFRDNSINKNPPYNNIRQKHFNDEYSEYTFWFQKKSDAFLFKLLTS